MRIEAIGSYRFDPWASYDLYKSMSSARGYTKIVKPPVINNPEIKKGAGILKVDATAFATFLTYQVSKKQGNEVNLTLNATRVPSSQYPTPYLVDIYV